MLVVARKFKVGTFGLPDLVQSGLLCPLPKPEDQSGDQQSLGRGRSPPTSA